MVFVFILQWYVLSPQFESFQLLEVFFVVNATNHGFKWLNTSPFLVHHFLRVFSARCGRFNTVPPCRKLTYSRLHSRRPVINIPGKWETKFNLWIEDATALDSFQLNELLSCKIMDLPITRLVQYLEPKKNSVENCNLIELPPHVRHYQLMSVSMPPLLPHFYLNSPLAGAEITVSV